MVAQLLCVRLQNSNIRGRAINARYRDHPLNRDLPGAPESRSESATPACGWVQPLLTLSSLAACR
jgi:hypothetical protein